jgi:hypothetical protein
MVLIMVVGFSTLYTFAVTTVFLAGQDAQLNAQARSDADELLASPVDPSSPDTFDETATIVWNSGAHTTSPDVFRESVGVDGARGDPRGSLNIFRRDPAP